MVEDKDHDHYGSDGNDVGLVQIEAMVPTFASKLSGVGEGYSVPALTHRPCP